jgi:hypothetical protein
MLWNTLEENAFFKLQQVACDRQCDSLIATRSQYKSKVQMISGILGSLVKGTQRSSSAEAIEYRIVLKAALESNAANDTSDELEDERVERKMRVAHVVAQSQNKVRFVLGWISRFSDCHLSCNTGKHHESLECGIRRIAASCAKNAGHFCQSSGRR